MSYYQAQILTFSSTHLFFLILKRIERVFEVARKSVQCVCFFDVSVSFIEHVFAVRFSIRALYFFICHARYFLRFPRHAFLCFFVNCQLFWCFALNLNSPGGLCLLVPASRYHWGTKFRRVCVCVCVQYMCVLCVVCVMLLCLCVLRACVSVCASVCLCVVLSVCVCVFVFGPFV